ncbi:MAG: dihydrodipicolinate synthase family protein, partial [Candidatus Latescibacterota bacterium]
MRIDEAVVTGQLLQERLKGEKRLEVSPQTKLTPSAMDYLRAHGVEVVRAEAGPAASAAVQAAPRVAVPAPAAGGRKAFKGIFCPNIVIFDAEGRINYLEMERYVDWLIQAGLHGLYPNGSTGEFVRLSWEERQDVVKLICTVNHGRVPVLAGASEANLRDVLRMAEFYAGIGVDAISLVAPYYYKISNQSLFEYFAEI